MNHLTAFVHFVMLAASTQQTTQPERAKDQPTAVAEHHAASNAVMELSIEKQRAAVRLQVGEGGPAAAFFTAPWTTPQVFSPPPDCVAMEESELAPLVKEVSLAQDINPGLIRAVIRRESNSFACAVSGKGAVGLMQLLPDTARQFGADPYDAKQNLQAGSKYLKQLLTRYKGDTKLALAAYNAGPERVDAAKGVPAIQETIAYVAAILKEIEVPKP